MFPHLEAVAAHRLASPADVDLSVEEHNASLQQKDLSVKHLASVAGRKVSIEAIKSTLEADGDGQLDPEDAAVLKLILQADIDGDGHISLRELMKFARSAHSTRKHNRQLVRGLVAALLIVVVALAALFGVTCFAYEVAKDTKPTSNGQLVTTSNTPVTVSVTEKELGLSQWPAQSEAARRKITDVTMTGSDGLTHWYTIIGWAWKSSTEMTLFSAAGDEIFIHGDDVTVTARDGSVIHDDSWIQYDVSNVSNISVEALARGTRRLATTTTTADSSDRRRTASRRRTVGLA